jgi:type II secretory pathway pseudopilin PulG
MNIIKTNRRALQSGTTLVELSVVIAVILLLVSVLFIGVKAWKDSANRAACLVNLATLQKAVRGYQNSHADDPLVVSVPANALATDGYFGTIPTCPAGAAGGGVAKYAPDAVTTAVAFPAAGVAAFACPNAGALNHAPTAANVANW